jgi:hypothetical protein
MRHGPLLLLFLLIFLSSPTVARDYYISPDGKDAGPGSFENPWQTVAPVNETDFKPGDQIFFRGGSSYTGPLKLSSADSGSAELNIQVASYGIGRGVLDGENGTAFSVEGSNHITISQLSLVGSGRKSGNTESGLMIRGASNITVDSVDASGFQKSGVRVDGSRNIRLTRIHAFKNGFAGISSSGEMSENIYVGYCLTENNPGDHTILNNHSGNGIVIGRVKNTLIEYNESRYNGWDMPRDGNGPVGIWVYHADNAVIQFNIAHHNRSPDYDGGGFDFDGGVTNSALQYNYSHNNFGSGYLICQYWGAAPFRDNVVRYNISQDDGLTNHLAGIHVWVGGDGMESTDVYNNTIFSSNGSAVSFGVDSRVTDELPKMTFRNNIFVSKKDQILGGSEKGRFEGNIYWRMGPLGFKVDDYTSFEEWVEATGQEKVGGKVVGMWADPRLRKDDTGLLTDPLKLRTLSPYMLEPGSPCIDRGLNLLELYQLDPGERDFYGNPLPQGTTFDIGVHEYRRAGSGPFLP